MAEDEGWLAAMLDGDALTGRALVKNGEQIAARYNVPFLHALAVADLPLPDLVARAKAVPRGADGQPVQIVGDALLGGIEEVGIPVREALEEYWKISIDQTRGKTADQIRRWKNPRIKAVENFV